LLRYFLSGDEAADWRVACEASSVVFSFLRGTNLVRKTSRRRPEHAGHRDAWQVFSSRSNAPLNLCPADVWWIIIPTGGGEECMFNRYGVGERCSLCLRRASRYLTRLVQSPSFSFVSNCFFPRVFVVVDGAESLDTATRPVENKRSAGDGSGWRLVMIWISRRGTLSCKTPAVINERAKNNLPFDWKSNPHYNASVDLTRRLWRLGIRTAGGTEDLFFSSYISWTGGVTVGSIWPRLPSNLISQFHAERLRFIEQMSRQSSNPSVNLTSNRISAWEERTARESIMDLTMVR